VIEGEGLGGFARRVTVNDSAERLFHPRRCFFQIAPTCPETAKPSAVRSQRLCLRPPKPYRAPNPSHGIGRVVELAAEGDQPDEESITLAHWFVVAKK
jgi:hypothetical protein